MDAMDDYAGLFTTTEHGEADPDQDADADEPRRTSLRGSVTVGDDVDLRPALAVLVLLLTLTALGYHAGDGDGGD